MGLTQPYKSGAIKIMLVDDHEVVRLGIAQALDSYNETQVVFAAANGEEAIAFAKENMPDVVLMDNMMPGLNGIETMQRLHELNPDIPVIFFTSNTDRRAARKALDAGARGFVSKSSNTHELTQAICQIYAGECYVEPDVARELDITSEGSACFQALSDRELEVAKLLASGTSTYKTAKMLNIDTSTVYTIRSRMLKKLGLTSLVELTHFMLERGEL